MKRCNSCQLLRINGVVCHEIGCPDAWRSYKRECKWCGSMFTPEDSGQQFCCDSCGQAYYGTDDLPGESRGWDDDEFRSDVCGGL